ncbi:TlpA family protein disulfide reductase [Corynebacterium flavescens]|uniref:TlpA family protein disulfide reductase n=1 Tax=Corynebacterium flavescens TaxID=28028 RepID=UPI003F8FF3AD
MRKYLFATVVAALVIGVIVVIAAASLLSGHSQRSGENREPAQGNEASPSTGALGGEDGEVASRPDCPAGPVAGVDLDCLGGQDSLPSADEGITVVNLWAWWCEPCRTELPLLEQAAKAHTDWQVVGVHADRDARKGAAFLNDRGIDLASYQDSDNAFAGEHGLPGVIPITLVLVDGQVKRTFIQPFESVEDIESAVQGALE